MIDADVQGTLTLEDVRTRFLEAEDHLSQASQSLGELQSAIESLGEAKDGLKVAGAEVGRLHVLFQRSIDAVNQNLGVLREGVDALQKGEPAQILRQISALEQSQSRRHRELMMQLAAARSERRIFVGIAMVLLLAIGLMTWLL